MLARGETLAAYALTEPETGSDAQHIVTRARLSDDGTDWILNGRKHWIGNGHRAGVIATFAQTEVSEARRDRAASDGLHHPPRHARLLASSGTVRKMGIRGSTQAELAYEDLRVPADHVLGTVGKGFARRGERAERGTHDARRRVHGGHEAASCGRWRVRRGSACSSGSPIADFEITQRKLARTATRHLRVGRDARRARAARRVARTASTRSRRRAARCSRARCSGARRTRWCRSPAGAAS